MLSDLKHAWCSLRRSPASALAAIAGLAVALGAGTTIAAVMGRSLLTPLPFPHPELLVVAGEVPFDEPAAPPRPISVATCKSSPYPVAQLAAHATGGAESVGGAWDQIFRKRDGARSGNRGVDGAQQIGRRIKVSEPGRFAQSVEDGGDLRPTLRARPVMILAPHERPAQRPLGGIVIKPDSGIIDKARQPSPAFQHGAHRLSEIAAR